MKKQFYQKVGKSKKAMVDFLTNHFRYNTMNSWNNSTSYANRVKVYDVIPRELQDKVFELMDAEGFYDDINSILEDFAIEQGNQWQAAFNGRSGGYIVLYQCEVSTKKLFEFKDNQDRDYQDGYGWLSLKEAKERGLYKKQVKKISCYPGRSIDQGEDFENWDIESIRVRVALVQSFDEMCDNVISQVISMAKECEVKEETYTVTKTRKVIA